jgi:hypothetical protein
MEGENQHSSVAGWFRHNGQYEVSEQVRSWANVGVVRVSRGVSHLEPVPGPVWDAEVVRHIIGGLVVAGHRFRGRPSEVVLQHLS